MYFAFHKIANNVYGCHCLSKNMENILGSVNNGNTPDPSTHVRCTEDLKQKNVLNVNANLALVQFLTNETMELSNTASMDTSELINLCNPKRVVNIITLYMIHFLGLNTTAFINGYVYNTREPFIYPAKYKNTQAPVNLTNYPNLEQAFWSVVQQYTLATETKLRKGLIQTYFYMFIISANIYLPPPLAKRKLFLQFYSAFYILNISNTNLHNLK